MLVLLATFEGAPWLERQLESIAAQRDVAVSLFLRDDASRDGTVAIARTTLERSQLPHRIAVSPRPGGSASANFFALIQLADAADADFVALADQDDVWDADKLSFATDAMMRTDASGYSSAVRAVWSDGRTSLLPQARRQTPADYLFEGAGQGCSFVIRADLFARCRESLRRNAALLPAIHFHDWALYALSRVYGNTWHFDPRATMSYRQHGGNDTGARSGRAGIARRLRLIRSGWYGRQVDAIVRLCMASADVAPAEVAHYLRLRSNPSPIARRAHLATFVLVNGRRRWTDRLVLLFAALTGHLTPTPHAAESDAGEIAS